MSSPTLQAFEQRILKIQESFKGHADRGEIIDQIILLTFLHMLSDAFWEDHLRIFKEYGKDDAAPVLIGELINLRTPTIHNYWHLQSKIQRPGFGQLNLNDFSSDPELERGTGWEYLCEHNLGKRSAAERLSDVVEQLVNLNPVLTGLENLMMVYTGGNHNPLLGSLIDQLNDGFSFHPQDWDGAHRVGECFEWLIRQKAKISGKYHGELYTPPELQQLMVSLVNPTSGETIYDPTCGSGSLLLKASHWVSLKQRKAQQSNSQTEDRMFRLLTYASEIGRNASEQIPNLPSVGLVGQEVNRHSGMWARMNMLVHAEPNFSVEITNTLTHPLTEMNPNDSQSEGKLRKFSVVIADPPIGLDIRKMKGEADPWKRFEPVFPNALADCAFVQHMLAVLTEEKGRIVTTIGNGALFRTGKEAEIRTHWLRENWVDAVINLPSGMLYSTGIPISILVLRKDRTEEDVLMIDTEALANARARFVREFPSSFYEQIAQAFWDRKEISGLSLMVHPQQILEKDSNLIARQYFPIKIETTDLRQLQQEGGVLSEELRKIQSNTNNSIAELMHLLNPSTTTRGT